MEVGDGTTSVCVLAAELLREAEKLVQSKIHPQTIIAGVCQWLYTTQKQHLWNTCCHVVFLFSTLNTVGWRQALSVAHKTLESSAVDHKSDECMSQRKSIYHTHSHSSVFHLLTIVAALREDLMNIARTTLSSKIVQQDKEHVHAIFYSCFRNKVMTHCFCSLCFVCVWVN